MENPGCPSRSCHNINALESLTNFDIYDFFEDPSENLDHLIGGGNVCYD